MGVGLRCWPTNQDYNNGKDCSASIATYANGAPGAPDAEVHCSADSLHKGGLAAAAAAESESPQEEPNHHKPPQVLPQFSKVSLFGLMASSYVPRVPDGEVFCSVFTLQNGSPTAAYRESPEEKHAMVPQMMSQPCGISAIELIVISCMHCECRVEDL